MNREVHVRFRENARVKSPCMTRLGNTINDKNNDEPTEHHQRNQQTKV